MKKILAILLALALVLSMAACGTKEEKGDTAVKSFEVYVTHADKTEKVFTYESSEEFLGTVLLAEGLIKGNEGPYGLEITQVDGESAVYATDGAYWALYVGQDYALTGVDTTPITDGGVYQLVYTLG